MSRRRAAEKREILPDPKYKDLVLAKFTNSLMFDGKKSVAEKIIYGAFEIIEKKAGQDPLKTFHEAMENVSPSVDGRSRQAGRHTRPWPRGAARGPPRGGPARGDRGRKARRGGGRPVARLDVRLRPGALRPGTSGL